MNIVFYQNILSKEFLSILNTTQDIELMVGYNKNETLSTVTQYNAVDNLFEMGLDINIWITTDTLNNQQTVPLIKEALFYAEDTVVIKKCLEHLDSNFFTNLPYKNQCSIIETMLDKFFLFDQKVQLLELLFSKGFKIHQGDANSVELEWFSQGHLELFEVLINKEFDWTHNYRHTYHDGESITLIDSINDAIEDSKSLTSANKESKIKTLYKLKEKIQTICNYSNLVENLTDKNQIHKKIKI